MTIDMKDFFKKRWLEQIVICWPELSKDGAVSARSWRGRFGLLLYFI